MSRPGLSGESISAAWSVSSVVRDICERAGIPYDRFSVDLIEGYADGFSTTSSHSAASAIEALSGIFLFDPASYDGMLHFIPRGGNVVADVKLDDLIDDGDEIEQVVRQDSITVPRVIHLEYYDTDGGLTADKQTSDRSLDNRSKSESTTETVVIMHADDAARAVTISHKVGVEEQRGELKFSLPDSWIHLTDTDPITFLGQRVRITATDVDEGQQNYRAIYDRVSAYESTISGVPIDQPSEPPSLIVSPSVIEVIDSHILRSADDQLGYYVAVSSETMNWSGAVVELSKDGGANWIDSDSTQANAVMGLLTASLDAHTHWYRDDFNTLTVELLREDMELVPATMAEMMNRSNLAIVGDELVNFSIVEQIGPKTWELRGLLRGRKGSGAVAHSLGERFVLLDVNDLTFVPAELFELNRTLTFRATSFGAEPGTDTTSITYVGRSQQERQAAYVHARRRGGNIDVSWQGVGRLGGGASVGMGQYFAGYDVWINDALQPRTFLTSGTYADPGGPVTVYIYQMNSITGHGPVAIGAVS